MYALKGKAFLVIDAQTYMVYRDDDSGGLLPAAEKLAALLYDVRLTQAMPVFHATMTSSPSKDVLRYDHQPAGLNGTFNTLHILANCRPEGHEGLLLKDRYSAFSVPGLHPDLQAHGVDHLYVVGFHTSACVEETVSEATHHGYKVTVIKEATASPAAYRTAQGLDHIRAAGGELMGFDDFRKTIFPRNPLAVMAGTTNPHFDPETLLPLALS